MAEITKIVNGQEISGMFPVQTSNPDQYGVYSSSSFLFQKDTYTTVPIISKIDGGLSDPSKNTIFLKQGLYLIQFPTFDIDNSRSLRSQRFVIQTISGNVIGNYSVNQDEDLGLIENPAPVFVFLLDQDISVDFKVYVHAISGETYSFNLSNNIYTNRFLIIKLDQPRISSLAGNAGNVDTVNFLEPDENTKNVQITHIYDTEEHWLNGYTRIDNNGNEHYEPPKSEVLKRDGAQIIKLWKSPEFPSEHSVLHPELWEKNTEIDLGTGLYGYWWKATVPLTWLPIDGSRRYSYVVPPPVSAKEIIHHQNLTSSTFVDGHHIATANFYTTPPIGGFQMQIASLVGSPTYPMPSTYNVNNWFTYTKE